MIQCRDPKQYEALANTFKQYFGFDKRRIDALAVLVLSVISAANVNLRELSLPFAARLGIKRDSLFRRLQRFFSAGLLSPRTVGRLVPDSPEVDRAVVSIDRTNWKFGKIDINILIAGVLHDGVAVPVAWMLLPARTRRGNSRTLHRARLLKQVLALLPASRIKALVADREFIGTKWIAHLENRGIPFIIRIRSNISIDGIPAKAAIRKGRLSPKRRRNRRFRVCGADVHVMVKPLKRKKQPDGTLQADWLILISSVYMNERRIAGFYRQRESIEHLFSHWKKRGFNFENTHMTDKGKLEQWVAVLTICLTICLLWGAKRNAETPIPEKTHGFRARSLFGPGMDDIREMLANRREKAKEWIRFLSFILNRLERAIVLT